MSLNVSELRHVLAPFHGAVREAVSLAPLSHLRIGGKAQFFVEPKTEEDVAVAVRAARELDQPLQVLGGGSNVLIADAGLPGLTLSLSALNRVMRDGTRITAGAGVTLPSLIRGTKDQGLAGFELLIGVPAVVGGAVAMNAGTRDTDTFERLVSVTVVDEQGQIRVLGKDQLAPSYRNGNLGEQIVVQATWELEEDDPQAIFTRMEASLKRRNATQPVTEKCLGCVFKNPEGDAAGRLIEAAGCKMLRHGHISVSGKHANYFINDGEGTATEFLELMREVQERVQADAGVELQPEVRIWGV